MGHVFKILDRRGEEGLQTKSICGVLINIVINCGVSPQLFSCPGPNRLAPSFTNLRLVEKKVPAIGPGTRCLKGP